MAESIRWEMKGWRDAQRAIAEMGRPDPRELDRVFDRMAEDIHAKVHVITGSLKASQHKESHETEDGWVGEIRYGGSLEEAPHPGPAKPVGYAIWERNRGGDHDFFGDVPLFYPEFERVVEDSATPRSRRERR